MEGKERVFQAEEMVVYAFHATSWLPSPTVSSTYNSVVQDRCSVIIYRMKESMGCLGTEVPKGWRVVRNGH